MKPSEILRQDAEGVYQATEGLAWIDNLVKAGYVTDPSQIAERTD